MPEPKAQNFYRWVDDHGTVHIVSTLDAVPVAERARMQHDVLSARPALAPERGLELAWSSVALGFGAGLVLALLLPRNWRWLTRAALLLGVAALGVGAYLSALGRSTGAGGTALLTTPSAIIEDAKATVERAKAAQQAREQELEQIRREGR